jgi:GT2 family glycosyltransferase
MRAVTSHPKPPVLRVPDHGDAQHGAIGLVSGDEELAAFSIDSAKVRGRRRLQLEGWSIGSLSFALELDGRPIGHAISRCSRPDVAAARSAPEDDEGHGWTIVSAPDAATTEGEWTLHVTVDHPGQGATHGFRIVVDPATPPSGALDPIQPLGFVEVASASPASGEAVVVGWAITPQGQPLFIEQGGVLHELEGPVVRFSRQDVSDTYRASHGDLTANAGFVLRVDELAVGQPVRLVTKRGDEMIVLGSTPVSALPSDPVAAARWLFGLHTPRHLLAQRMASIDLPLLDPLIALQRCGQQLQPVEVHQLGQPVAHPQASIIVPLYGRLDFVEHQLIEFSRDPWISAHAEVVYVLDDPRLVEPFAQQAHTWHRLYRLPFKWVWGGTNRGFSGANNLGAANSRAPLLTFLNSDAFPQRPGWLQTLIAELQANPGLGAVAPRLVFADGSIQHAGMEFTRRDEWGIWINHHPRMGLAASLDPHTQTTTVPAITGACLVIERDTLDAAGAWDTGYLIGDFEDSDLCLKLRANGLRVAYVPGVQLTHLERQSFKLLGQDDFRQKVVIYNAVRHQARWAGALRELGQAA